MLMNLINAIKNYFETELNAINPNVVIDMGYLFERDVDGSYVTKSQKTGSYVEEETHYVPSMLQFKGDWNKPLNYTQSNQIAKSGTVVMWFSLPDRDIEDSDIPFTFEDVITVLETFENKFTGYRESGVLPTITHDSKVYSLDINSSPLVDNGGIVKTGAQWRTLVTLSLSLKMGHNIAYGGDVRTLIKKYGADDSTYVEIELSNISGGIASATNQSQEDTEKFAKAGITVTALSKQFVVYYPKGDAYTSVTGAKDMLLEFFQTVADKDYTNDLQYTIKTIYPDFEGLTDWKFIGSTPTVQKGVELSTVVVLNPKR